MKKNTAVVVNPIFFETGANVVSLATIKEGGRFWIVSPSNDRLIVLVSSLSETKRLVVDPYDPITNTWLAHQESTLLLNATGVSLIYENQVWCLSQLTKQQQAAVEHIFPSAYWDKRVQRVIITLNALDPPSRRAAAVWPVLRELVRWQPKKAKKILSDANFVRVESGVATALLNHWKELNDPQEIASLKEWIVMFLLQCGKQELQSEIDDRDFLEGKD